MKEFMRNVTIIEWMILGAIAGIVLAIIIQSCTPSLEERYDCSKLSEEDRRSYALAISECEMNSCVERVTSALCVEIKEFSYE